MKTSVFFSVPGKGFFEAEPPENVKTFLYPDLVQWAAQETIRKNYKQFIVSSNPNFQPSGQI